jgi:hypothetical protein
MTPEPPPRFRELLGNATGRGIRIGVIDTGWDRAVADPRVLPGVGLTDPDDDFALLRTDDDNDRLGHGTACADLICAWHPRPPSSRSASSAASSRPPPRRCGRG